MTVYLKKQIFAFDHSYDLFDQWDQPMMSAKRDPSVTENCITITNQKGRLVFHANEFTEGKRPTFELYKENHHVGTLYKEVTWKKKEFMLDLDNVLRMTAEQMFPSNAFDLRQDGSLLATAKKDTTPWRETFCIDLVKPEDLQLFLGILLISLNIYGEEW